MDCLNGHFGPGDGAASGVRRRAAMEGESGTFLAALHDEIG